VYLSCFLVAGAAYIICPRVHMKSKLLRGGKKEASD
jgi:hypothetical protein